LVATAFASLKQLCDFSFDRLYCLLKLRPTQFFISQGTPQTEEFFRLRHELQPDLCRLSLTLADGLEITA